MSSEQFKHALSRYAASAVGRNATLDAIAAACPTTAEPVEAAVPFVARRRWGAVRLAGTSYLLGAPELFPLADLVEVASREARSGRRVLAFGTTSQPLESPAVDSGPPSGMVTVGLVILAEALRPNARLTVEFLLSQGIEIKVLSGDAPETVASIAADVGIPTDPGVIDGRTLPSDPSALQSIARGATVIGRASPEVKRRIVQALQHAGLHVTMVGDGVNDVPALKAARLAIAQGSGSEMTRSVADLILVTGDFGVIPVLVAEGRRVLRNLQRVTKLYVMKSAFAAFLILAIGITPTSYPLLPRHLTLAAALTIGIPSFFLALAPSAGRWRPTAFLRQVARFAVPAGTAAGLGVVSSYHFALNALDLPLIAARSVATTVLVTVGLYLILALEVTGRVRAVAVVALCAALAIGYATILSLPAARSFFALAAPNTAILLVAAGGALVAISGLCLTDDQFIPGRANHGNGEDAASELAHDD
jgi:cation-transporting ATPase E